MLMSTYKVSKISPDGAVSRCGASCTSEQDSSEPKSPPHSSDSLSSFSSISAPPSFIIICENCATSEEPVNLADGSKHSTNERKIVTKFQEGTSMTLLHFGIVSL